MTEQKGFWQQYFVALTNSSSTVMLKYLFHVPSRHSGNTSEGRTESHRWNTFNFFFFLSQSANLKCCPHIMQSFFSLWLYKCKNNTYFPSCILMWLLAHSYPFGICLSIVLLKKRNLLLSHDGTVNIASRSLSHTHTNTINFKLLKKITLKTLSPSEQIVVCRLSTLAGAVHNDEIWKTKSKPI